jgi:hypothetical protein
MVPRAFQAARVPRPVRCPYWRKAEVSILVPTGTTSFQGSLAGRRLTFRELVDSNLQPFPSGERSVQLSYAAFVSGTRKRLGHF